MRQPHLFSFEGGWHTGGMSESRRAVRAEASTAAEKWRQRIAEHLSSGQSVAAFCRGQDISENSFYVWKRRLRRGDVEGFASTPTPFVELKPSPAAVAEVQTAGIEVCLRHQRRLRVRPGFDRDLLIDLVR